MLFDLRTRMLRRWKQLSLTFESLNFPLAFQLILFFFLPWLEFLSIERRHKIFILLFTFGLRIWPCFKLIVFNDFFFFCFFLSLLPIFSVFRRDLVRKHIVTIFLVAFAFEVSNWLDSVNFIVIRAVFIFIEYLSFFYGIVGMRMSRKV